MLTRLQELWARRELVGALASRDLQIRYRGSVFGLLWSLMHPLVLAAVYLVAFRYVIRIPIPNYALFLLAGLLPWIFVASSLGMAATSIVDQGQLIKKLSFPREVLPIATVVSQFVHFAVGYLAVVPPLAAYSVGLGPSVLLVPVLMVLLALFTCGLALAMATAQVYLRDTRHLLDVALQVWFWLTPVVYSLDLVPARFRPLFMLNPLALFLTAFRDATLLKTAPPIGETILLSLLTTAVFVAGYAVFLRGQRRVAEHI
jgi:ABC-type polysaccharide/polyol phosphate export permease